MGQQPGREQPPALPTTRAGHAQVPANEDAPKVRFSPRLAPQPVGFATLRVNQERHLTDRQTYKERRSAALAEWQSFAALSFSQLAKAQPFGDKLRLD